MQGSRSEFFRNLNGSGGGLKLQYGGEPLKWIAIEIGEKYGYVM